LINGKLVRLEQIAQAAARFVTLDVLINGKLVACPALTTLSKLEQPFQAYCIVVTAAVLISGNDSRLEQPLQVLLIDVTAAELMPAGND